MRAWRRVMYRRRRTHQGRESKLRAKDTTRRDVTVEEGISSSPRLFIFMFIRVCICVSRNSVQLRYTKVFSPFGRLSPRNGCPELTLSFVRESDMNAAAHGSKKRESTCYFFSHLDPTSSRSLSNFISSSISWRCLFPDEEFPTFNHYSSRSEICHFINHRCIFESEQNLNSRDYSPRVLKK